MSLQSQIASWLEGLIAKGELPAGGRIPPEAMLVDQLGVSRVTVRLAIDDLIARGLVTRSHGKGSFVSRVAVQHDLLTEQGFFDVLLASAAKPEARLVEFIARVPPRRVANVFGLAPGEKAMSIDRLYLTAGRPVVFAAGWLTMDAARLSRADVEARSTATLHAEVLHHPVTSSTTARGADLVEPDTARLLGMCPRSAVLTLTRSRFDAAGLVREHNRFTIDSSAYEITLSDTSQAPLAAVLRAIAA